MFDASHIIKAGFVVYTLMTELENQRLRCVNRKLVKVNTYLCHKLEDNNIEFDEFDKIALSDIIGHQVDSFTEKEDA